jgi:hypothetical protein
VIGMREMEYVFESLDIGQVQELFKKEMKLKYDIKTYFNGNNVLVKAGYRYNGVSLASFFGSFGYENGKTILKAKYIRSYFGHIFVAVAVAFIVFINGISYIASGDTEELLFILGTLVMGAGFVFVSNMVTKYDYKLIKNSLKWLDGYACDKSEC